tara:strand:+ start:2204 stop:2644 length:441 start_codon:yes stop_codon:yes gene_type:complete
VSDKKPKGGIKVAAEMLEYLSSQEREKILENVSKRDPAIASRLRSQIRSFESLLKVQNKGMQRLIRELDISQIVKALKISSDEMKSHFFSHMSMRMAEEVKENIAQSQKMKKSDVYDTQKKIVDLALELESQGLLVFSENDEEWVD